MKSFFLFLLCAPLCYGAAAQCTTPTVTASGSTTFCPGGSVTLSAPASNVWTRKADFGGGEREGAIGFSIGSKGYIGTGGSDSGPEKDFWEYDPGYTYSWSPSGQTTASLTVAATGNYSVTTTNALGCSAISAPTAVSVNAAPAAPLITASDSTSFCEGGSVTLSAPDGFAAYRWSSGDSTRSITVSQAGSYTLTVTNGNGCTSPPSTETKVVVKAVPPKPVITAGGPLTFCPGGSLTLTASQGFAAYQWSNGATTRAITVAVSGSYSVTVGSEAGCTSAASDPLTVSVEDKEKPVIAACPGNVALCNAANGMYTIAPLQASDNCSTPVITYTITGATTRNGSGPNASGTFNPGTSTINWTVRDPSGNTANCQTIVTANTALAVSVPDDKALSSGVNANTVYLGYTPAGTLTLSANATGGSGSYGYQWSTGALTPSVNVSPTSATTYTVAVTDARGCSGTANKVVEVVDVSCGGSKVNVCHKGKNTLCIDKTSVPDHLGHGDYLGACQETTTTAKTAAPVLNMTIEEASAFALTASPNPSTAFFTLRITATQKEKVMLTVTDALGRVVETRVVVAGERLQVGERYAGGLYMATAVQGGKRVAVKLVKL